MDGLIEIGGLRAVLRGLVVLDSFAVELHVLASREAGHIVLVELIIGARGISTILKMQKTHRHEHEHELCFMCTPPIRDVGLLWIGSTSFFAFRLSPFAFHIPLHLSIPAIPTVIPR